jgi:hypothetical protein
MRNTALDLHQSSAIYYSPITLASPTSVRSIDHFSTSHPSQSPPEQNLITSFPHILTHLIPNYHTQHFPNPTCSFPPQMSRFAASIARSHFKLPVPPLHTTQVAFFQSKPRRPNPAGVPKGLPPKIVHVQQKLTPAEIQLEEERQKYVVKEFMKTKAKWNPNPKLVQCNNVAALEHYLWDHHQRLRWFRGKIADTSRRAVKRSYLRTHISIHKKVVKYIENKILALKGELRVPKLLDPVVPHRHDNVNPFINHITITDRVPRAYDYPLKETFEPFAQVPRQWTGVGNKQLTPAPLQAV